MRSPKSPRRPLQHRLFSAVLLATFCMAWVAPAASATGRYETLRAQDLRVATVAYRLSLANRAACRENIAPQLGLVLHSLGQYGATDREAAALAFGLDRHVNVMAVVEGSPAAKAGIRPGDRLFAVNGQGLGADSSENIEPGRPFVDRASGIITEEMKKGPVTVRLSSPAGERTVAFAAEGGCPTNVELAPGDVVNAWADGSRVVVSAGIVARCRTDDDLALVIAHELAHNLLHHKERLASSRSTSGHLFIPSGEGSALMGTTEEEADRFAVRLAKAAGYDLSGSGAFLKRLAEPGLATSAPTTHPALTRRTALLKAEIAAIDAAR
jgi:hypothetical protein